MAAYPASITGSAPFRICAVIRAATKPLPDVWSRRTDRMLRRRTSLEPSALFMYFIRIDYLLSILAYWYSLADAEEVFDQKLTA